MSLPDSGWITGLQKLAWWVFAGVAVGMGGLRVLGYSGIWIEAPGLIALCLLVFRALDSLWESRKSRIRRSFKRLNQKQQQQFLIDRYNSGSRRFEREEPVSSTRWVEELQDWNYIEWISPVIISPWSSYTYYVTAKGWAEVEKHVRRGSAA